MKRIPLLLFIAFLFVYCNKETNSPESVLPSLPCLCCDTTFTPTQPSVGITDTNTYLYVASAFTPNGDNVNDCFTIGIGGILNYTMTILDTAGVSIFSGFNDSSSINANCWDGNNYTDGKYHWILDGLSFDSSLFHFEGNMYLVKDLTSSNSGFLNFPNGKDDCTFSDMIDDQLGFIYPTQENLSNWGN